MATEDNTFTSELDGDGTDPIAICGFSIKFPQEATSAEAFWQMIVDGRCAMTDFPNNRFNAQGFYQKKKKLNAFSLRGGHFIDEDPSLFDADFFSISPAEAAGMDPMQRWLLEGTYRALENSGIPMEKVSGSSTAVYTGSFSMDYAIQLYRDAESPPPHAATGVGLSMLANRISWFFNLQGPSVAIDTACSSTATALNLAQQALQAGTCDMSLVTGCNLILSPENLTWLSNMSLLSPDSRCYSFDHRANGYSRGEGIAVVVLKRLSDAIRDGNTIRAVIRATHCNEDGWTPGITHPNGQAQVRLINDTYRKALLSKVHTRYFESHGTGTAAGDPIEAATIGECFRQFRSPQDPIYVGAVKSNIGHLEGASALAGLIKAIMVLERGIIPPNTNFEKLNPNIDRTSLGIEFPQKPHPWPTKGLRRASINSFGYGGANSHIVLDDAYNYMLLRGLQGKHCTETLLGFTSNIAAHRPAMLANPHTLEVDQAGPLSLSARNSYLHPRLLVISAAEEKGIDRIARLYEHHLARIPPHETEKSSILEDLACTLDSHRSQLAWRAFAIVQTPLELGKLQSLMSVPVKKKTKAPSIGFVFTGQGAQWFAMGRELLSYDSFRRDIDRATNYLTSIGCSWSVFDEMWRPEGTSNIDKAEFSQSICAVLQVALVNLLRRFGLQPQAVVGHSSGEIAAAYAGGYISAESAWRLAYFRGLCSADMESQSSSSKDSRGTMMAVGLPEHSVRDLVSTINQRERTSLGVSIACVNSPRSVTVAGDASAIDRLKEILDQQKAFSRKLRVNVAYHTTQVEEAAAKYKSMIGQITTPTETLPSVGQIPMVSSVTGKVVSGDLLVDPAYWAANMSKPVIFSAAVAELCVLSSTEGTSNIDKLIEIGPHSALQGYINEILRSFARRTSIGYGSVLRRGETATWSTLRLMGELYASGVGLNLRVINEPDTKDTERIDEAKLTKRQLLVDLPEYPFDHSHGYWHEGRLSKNYRFRQHPPSEFLGVRSRDWNSAEPRWQHFMKTSDIPWTADHVVNGRILYPAAGMIVMAIEGARQLSQDGGKSVDGYALRDVDFSNPIDITDYTEFVEVQTAFRKVVDTTYEFTIRSINTQTNDWMTNCRGIITTQLSDALDDWVEMKNHAQRQQLANRFSSLLSTGCHKNSPPDRVHEVDYQQMYQLLKDSGLDFGPRFRIARSQRYDDDTKTAAAEIALFMPAEDDQDETHVIHPVSLDAVFHLSLTAMTCGGSRSIATMVPNHVTSIWILNKAPLGYPELQTLEAYSSINDVTSRGFSCSGVALGSTCDSGEAEIRLCYEGLDMISVTSNPAVVKPSVGMAETEEQLYCMRVECLPALDKLEPDQISSLLERLHPSEVHEDVQFWSDLEMLVELTLEELVSSVDATTLRQLQEEKPWKVHYWNWVLHQLSERKRIPNGSGDEKLSAAATGNESIPLGDLKARLANKGRIADLCLTAASELVDMFKGIADPLEVLMQSGILKAFYEELKNQIPPFKITEYVNLLAHQRPGMNILEVGAGTGAGTWDFMNGLARANDRDGSTHDIAGSSTGAADARSRRLLRCNRYDFTDISPTLLDGARRDFEPYHSQMTFGTLDIGRDYAPQGYPDGAYDIVMGFHVLHVTSDLRAALRRARKALKVGGKLILQELFSPSGWIWGFAFGLLQGWWLGAADGRVLSPTIALEQWNVLLKETGFSGADIVFESGRDSYHHSGWFIATAVADTQSPPLPSLAMQPRQTGYRVRIVHDKHVAQQVSLQRDLTSSLKASIGVDITVHTIEEAAQTDTRHIGEMEDEITIFLGGYADPFFTQLDQGRLTAVQLLVQKNGHILWLSSGGGRPTGWSSPEHGMLDGLTRTIRYEMPKLHLVTLALDEADMVESSARQVKEVVKEMLARVPGQQYEQEYVAINGLLHTRRFVEASDLQNAIHSKVVPYTMIQGACDGDIRFKLSTASSDNWQDDIPHYVRTTSPAPTLKADGVDIQVRSVVLQPPRADAFSPPGDQKGHCFGKYFSGVVVEAGAGAEFQSGDHVFGISPPGVSAVRSNLMLSSRTLAGIPQDVTFTEMCQSGPPLIAAYHLLFEAHGFEATKPTLVLDGVCPVGQAILIALIDQGMTPNLWTTVANGEESDVVARSLGIPEERILPKAWFESNSSMTPSQWKGMFDVVLAAKYMPPTAVLISTVRSGGRLIVLHDDFHPRPSSFSSTNRVSDGPFAIPSSVSVVVIDLGEVHPSLESLKYATAKCRDARLVKGKEYIHSMTSFPLAAVVDAFDHLKKSKNGRETVTLDFQKADVVPVRSTIERQPYLLDPRATYLIAGGLGGLGRAMARWLVGHGARFLILLSRTGARTQEALELLADLREKGVVVEAPPCDVSDRVSLRNTLAALSCSGREGVPLPPIKGCIQASMVMIESFFTELDFDDWTAAVSPKVTGSWNLHTELPRDLDFFILLSSISGVLGAKKLAAYNAGNTYQSALARFRMAQGEHAQCLDLGAVTDEGYLAERDRLRNTFFSHRNRFVAPITMDHVVAWLDIYCEPHVVKARSSEASCQDIVGIKAPVYWKHQVDAVPFPMAQPIWGHMHHLPVAGGVRTNDHVSQTSSSDPTMLRRRLLDRIQQLSAHNASLEEAAKVVADALAQQVSALLSIPINRSLDREKAIVDFGIDSLSAIELRDWILDFFAVEMPVFELLGGTTLTAVGASIASKLKLSPVQRGTVEN